jgi:hypothetical protein
MKSTTSEQRVCACAFIRVKTHNWILLNIPMHMYDLGDLFVLEYFWDQIKLISIMSKNVNCIAIW